MIAPTLISLLAVAFGSASGQDIGCFVPGQCQGGNLVGIIANVNTSVDCHSLCRMEPTCHYFTYEAGDQFCSFYDTCPEVSTDICHDCLSGDLSCFCNVPGRCNGDVLYLEANSNCSQLCYKERECRYWTLDSATESCVLYTSCPEIDSSCSSCLSGEGVCYEGIKPPRDFLLYVGGYNVEASVQVIDLSGQNRECEPIPDYPHGHHGSAMSTFKSQPVLCGGEDLSECWLYDRRGNSWLPFAPLNQPRQFHSSLQLDEGSFAMAGGNNDGDFLLSVDTYTVDGNHFSMDLDLPVAVQDFCLVSINRSHAILAGGEKSDGIEDRAFLLNRLTWEWSPLPSLQTARHVHVCGIVGDQFYAVGGETTDSVEMISLDTLDEWVDGPPLPNTLYGAKAIQYGGSLLVVGGYFGGYMSDILSLDVNQPDAWTVRDEELETARRNGAAGLVSIDELNC